MKNKKCLTPHWGTSTHDVVYQKICNELNLENISFKDLISSKISYLTHFLIVLEFFQVAPILLITFFKKNDIRSLKYRDINIGHAINETSITYSKKAKFSLLDIKYVYEAITLYHRLNGKLANREISLILGGDEAYIWYSVAAQLGIIHKVPTYFLRGGVYVFISEFDAVNLTASPKYEEYPKIVKSFLVPERLSLIESNLKAKIAGDKSSLIYMPPKIKDNWKEIDIPEDAFWIYLHDFYDSPGLNGGNIYPSHCHWLEETVKYLRSLGQKICIKRHPNERPQNKKIISYYKSIYNDADITWLDEDLPIVDLKKFNPKAILSVYGSVIVEASYAGLIVITSGRSKYCGFDIAYAAKSILDYQTFLSLAAKKTLLAKEKKLSILADYALREMPFVEGRYINCPFNDITKEMWDEMGYGTYPEHHYIRRAKFLYDPRFKDSMCNFVKKIKICEMLRIECK